ncbi:MAG TPA: hypothetical protein VG125_11460 [Pirellulales bacterium]|nr:hypothetical protein [Pirellulales bacterium]
MSYRSIKRHLGETHLERKFLAMFGLWLVLLIGSSFWLYSHRTDRMVEKQNSATGRRLVDVSMMAAHWEKINFAGNILDQTHDKDWMEYLKTLGLQGRDYDCVFLRPADTDHAAPPGDPYDADLLDELSQTTAEDRDDDGNEPRKERYINNGEQYVYYRPV